MLRTKGYRVVDELTVGQKGEITVNTAGTQAFVHDGVTPGGNPIGGGGSAQPMGASGPSHAAGSAPDPGSTAGSYRFLREDATWASPDQINGTVGTVRNIATRCRHDEQYYTGANLVQCAGRTLHVNMGPTVYGPQIVLGNWIANNTGEIVPSGGAITEMCSIEYPAGEFTLVSWDAANASATHTETISINAGGADVVSDPVPVRIPAGATFWVRRVSWFTSGTAAEFPVSFSPVAGPNNNGGVSDTSFTGYTAFQTGSTVDPRTYVVGGTLPAGTSMAQLRFPLAILGLSNVASALLLGDSRCAGYNDSTSVFTVTENPTTNLGTLDYGRWGLGEIARSIGRLRPYANLGCPTDSAHNFVTLGNTFRARQAAYHTDVIVQYGVNDVNLQARTGAAAMADLQTIYALFPTKRVWGSTVLPVSTSTDSWATTANQTTAGTNAQRVILNTDLRAVPAPLVGIFDNAAVVETSLNSGIWNVFASIGQPTNDGLHPNPVTYKYIDIQKSVDPTRLTSI